jgi:O-antigen/teichoic acid export membrane protein
MILARSAGALAVVISVPFLVDQLDPQGYGVWESVLALASVALVFQTVISQTLLWRMSVSFGSQDQHAARELVRIGVTSTLLLIFVAVPIAKYFDTQLAALLQIPPRSREFAEWIIPAVVGIRLLGGVNEAMSAVLNGYQRAGVAAWIHSAGVIATYSVAVAALSLGSGLESLLYGFTAGFIVRLVILYPVASSLCGRISLRPTLPTSHDVAVLLPFAGLLLISNLSGIFRDQADKIVLASLGAPIMVGYFSLAQRFGSLIMQAFAVINVPFCAAIGTLHARNDREGIRALYTDVGTWIAVLGGLVCFLVGTMRTPLFIAWLGRDYPEAHVFLALILAGMLTAISFAGASAALVRGVGRPGAETQYALVTLVLTLLSKPLFIVLFGPKGAVASSAISWGLGSVWLLITVHKRLELEARLARPIVGAFAFACALSTAGWFAGSFMPSDLGRLQAAALVVGLGALLIACFLIPLVALRVVVIPRVYDHI